MASGKYGTVTFFHLSKVQNKFFQSSLLAKKSPIRNMHDKLQMTILMTRRYFFLPLNETQRKEQGGSIYLYGNLSLPSLSDFFLRLVVVRDVHLPAYIKFVKKNALDSPIYVQIKRSFKLRCQSPQPYVLSQEISPFFLIGPFLQI